MTSARLPLAIVFVMAIIGASATSAVAQQPGHDEGAAGAGWLAPGVFATWEGHREMPADRQSTDTSAVPLTIDLLVLWRGNPGWFDYAQVSASAGGPDGTHGVTSRDRSVGIRFNRATRTVQIQRQALALQGANVLLLDDVDNPNGVLIAGTRQVDPLITAGHGAGGEPGVDPVSEIIRQSPELFDFLRCDPAFADPNDSGAAITLGRCGQLR